MTLVALPGEGPWFPNMPHGFTNTGQFATNDNALLDADEEEIQFIGAIRTSDGLSHTFGTSSVIGWFPGASINFGAGSTVTVGLKKTSVIDTANGPAARATIGAAAFSMSKALTGGTDTITSTTWRNDTMTAGTPFTVANGELHALCIHLDTTSGTPSIKIRTTTNTTGLLNPTTTLVTAGPTYTAQAGRPDIFLTFDDGAFGWMVSTDIYSTVDAASSTVGNTNIFGNIFQFPVPVKISAIAASINLSTSAANASLDLYSTPFGTPFLVEGVAQDANVISAAGSMRLILRYLSTPYSLAKNTDIAVGVRQTTATAITVNQRDVSTVNHWLPSGMGSSCYGVTSTAGATFADANATKKRRFNVWVQLSHLDDGRRYRARAFTGF